MYDKSITMKHVPPSLFAKLHVKQGFYRFGEEIDRIIRLLDILCTMDYKKACEITHHLYNCE